MGSTHRRRDGRHSHQARTDGVKTRQKENDANESAHADNADLVSRRQFVNGLAAAFGDPGADVDFFTEIQQRLAAQTRTAGAPPKEWHELGDLIGMVYLIFLRDWLRNSNLYDTENPPLAEHTGPIPSDKLHARTLDGTFNDLKYPSMGLAGRRLGRNVPLPLTHPDPALLDPNPRKISLEVMTLTRFKPVEAINVLAAAWIQFQVHDWFAHVPHPSKEHEVPLPAGDMLPDGRRCDSRNAEGWPRGASGLHQLRIAPADGSQLYRRHRRAA